MKKENIKSVSNQNHKQVIRGAASFIGIELTVTEVDINPLPANFRSKYFSYIDKSIQDIDYTIEAMEWEVSFLLNSDAVLTLENEGLRLRFKGSKKVLFEQVKTANRSVVLSHPYFEGDVDTFKNDMALIRLTGLNADEAII